MLNAKLNHLHVLCLLRMAVTRNKPASDPELVSTSVEILHLIVEAIMQKDYLVNSGTSLVWKVRTVLSYRSRHEAPNAVY